MRLLDPGDSKIEHNDYHVFSRVLEKVADNVFSTPLPVFCIFYESSGSVVSRVVCLEKSPEGFRLKDALEDKDHVYYFKNVGGGMLAYDRYLKVKREADPAL